MSMHAPTYRAEPARPDYSRVPLDLDLAAPARESLDPDLPRSERFLITDFLRERTNEWRDRILERYGAEVDFELEGAMRCDLYRGMRPSKNPMILGRPVREADFSMRVGDELDPHGPEVAEIVKSVLGAEPAGVSNVNGWGKPSRLSMFYAYLEVPGLDEPIEIELCVQRQSETCEISEYWHRLFSADEIVEQRAARDRAEMAGPECYAETKHRQNEEAKFRLLYQFSRGALVAPECVSDLVQDWWRHMQDEAPSTLAPDWAKEARVEAARRLRESTMN